MPKTDEYGNVIYTQGEYEHHLMMGVPFSGFVEDVGYVLSEIVVTPHPINASGTQFVWEIDRVEFLYELDYTDYSSEIVDNQMYSKSEETDSTPSIIQTSVTGTAMSLNYLGYPGASKRFVMPGATTGTSIASILLRNTPLHTKPVPSWLKGSSHANLIPFLRNTRIPASGGASSYGVALGRKVPFWGMKGTALGVGFSAYNIHSSGYAPKVITQEASGWAGAWIGAKLGASGGVTLGGSIGAAVGTPVGGVGAIPGAGLGAVIGGFIGSIIGGIGGYWGGYTLSGEVYDGVTK